MTLAFIVWVVQILFFAAVAATSLTVFILGCWAVVFAIGWVLYRLVKVVTA